MSRVFLQVDLKQAESRFVAYDSCDENLIAALTDPSRDIHSEVAAEIFECSVGQVRDEAKAGDTGKRQLGKKSGHSANYDGKPATLQESCLKELGLVIDMKFATKISDAYHRLFPGVRKWHKGIRDTVYSKRRLDSPFGRQRYFYGRMDDATFREAYAYRPQSTIPDVTNHLMLATMERRREELPDFWLHLQTHDSLIYSLERENVAPLADYMLDLNWHPRLILPAGPLVIPVSIEVGECLGEMETYERT